jgi:ubiquinone/menaquinone biosynthesis C-methylase UbiE
LARRINGLWNPFGKEYAWAPKWNLLERFYIQAFGIVDLPSRLRARAVIREVLKFKKEDVLDLGSGTGCYSLYFSRWPSTRVWGIDINGSRIFDCEEIAKRLRRNNLRFYAGDGHLGVQTFCSISFDQVISIEALQCFPNTKSILDEIKRILKPGGILIGHVPTIGYLREFEKTLFDDEKLRELLIGSGFEIISITPTFGRVTQQLCQFFGQVTRFKVMIALLFPFLLLASYAFKIESSDGTYRLFVARKP